MTDDDLVPVSVRLGEVVPPDDPEDWTRPLTWLAAGGMLAGPLVAFLWFVVAPPAGVRPVPVTWLLTAAIPAGAALTGATQIRGVHAFAGTLGAGLFACLGTVVMSLVFAGERQVEVASPTLVHAVAAITSGIAGTVAASAVALVTSRRLGRVARWVLGAAAGIVAALGALAFIT